MADQKIKMDVSETLELDYLVEDVSRDIVNINKNPNGLSKSYYSTDTFVFDPSGVGIYEIDIKDQVIEIEVTDIPDSGVSYYEFEDDSDTTTATDSWGTNDGTISGAAYTTTAQVGSLALDFDGDDDYVTLGQNALATKAPFSVSTWINPDDWTSTRLNYIAAWEQTTDPFSGWAIRDDSQNNSPLEFNLKDGSGNAYRVRTTRPTTDSWTMITATYDTDGTLALYKDDSQAGENTNADGSLNQVTADVTLGARDAGADRFYDGVEDDVRFYDKALSATEVTNLFNTGSI
jgi:hypothetical protein